MTKQPVVCDVECYANYMLVGFKSVANGTTMIFERHEDSDTYIDTPLLLRVLRNYTIVTFNGRSYDMPMIVAAANGAANAELKRLSDRIVRENIRWWDVERELGISVPQAWDHIDLSEPAPGVAIPLKLYGARMHSKRLQDLPVEPDAVLTPEQIVTLRDYNVNSDLPMTVDLWNAIRPDIELREHMTERYGIDMRSKSGAQIAEAIIKSEVKKVLGRFVDPPVIDMDRKLKFKSPLFLEFRTEQLRDLFRSICVTEFEIANSGAAKIPPTLTNAKVKIGGTSYKLGIGGLHSNEESQTLYAGDDHEIHDDDVASFYPSIILQCCLFPPNMGNVFLVVYRKIFNERIAAKKRANELKSLGELAPRQKAEMKDASMIADTNKLITNSTFGKFSNMYSNMYSPENHLQVTLTGQLALLMLIECLEEHGISVVSANTDGIVTRFPKHLRDIKTKIVHAWEQRTGFNTENTQYRAIHSRDVNNYVAVKLDGKVKTKGVFAETGLMKNPSNQVCVDAVVAYLTHGTPIRQTIESCTDIRKFINAQRVTGGAVWQGQHLGRVVRSYKSIFAVSKITYGAGKKEGHKVPDSDPVQPLMVLPDEFPNDVDFDYYVDVAEQMLVDIGVEIAEIGESSISACSQSDLWGDT